MGTYSRICKVPGCGLPIEGSATVSADRRARGLSEETRCPKHKAEHDRLARGTSSLAYVETVPARPDRKLVLLSEGFGLTSHPDTTTRYAEAASQLLELRKRFALTDDDIRSVYTELEKHQVVVVVSGTGTGKSTFLPYSLIEPLEGEPRDKFTALGQVVVTQPRIAPTESISDYVGSRLVGTGVGPRYEVGFRNSEAPSPTDDNRLVYTTDGTLINWILGGRLEDFSIVMIDEAHERSLNIDLILGLLKKELPLYPHLRVLIASATIDAGLFQGFFGDESSVPILDFPGVNYGYDLHWPAEGPEIDFSAAQLVPKLTSKAVTLAIDVVRSIVAKQRESGDVLVFAATRRQITDIIDQVGDVLCRCPELAGNELLPPHPQLSAAERRRALSESSSPEFPRIIVATNIAETSLTVRGVKYVIDTGLVLRTRWDTDTLRTSYDIGAHSQDGCRQRWGRAGRESHGEVFVLYAEEQFKQFEPHTPPEIQCAPLESVVLKAKAAGIDDVTAFPWIEAPAAEELARAERRLCELGAIDEEGDLTLRGAELAGFAMSPEYGAVMIEADRLCCAPEAAVLLAYLGPAGGRSIFCSDNQWSAATRMLAADATNALVTGCDDDLELLLKVYAAWHSSTDPELWAARNFIDHDLLCRLEAGRVRLLGGLSKRKKQDEERPCDLAMAGRLRLALAHCLPDQVYIREEDGGDYRPRTSRQESEVLRLADTSCAAQGEDSTTSLLPRALLVLTQPQLADGTGSERELTARFVARLDIRHADIASSKESDYLDAVTEVARASRPSTCHTGARVSADWPLGSRVLLRVSEGAVTLERVLAEPPCPEILFRNGVRHSALQQRDEPVEARAVLDAEEHGIDIPVDETEFRLSKQTGCEQEAAERRPVQGVLAPGSPVRMGSLVGSVVGFVARDGAVLPVVHTADPERAKDRLVELVASSGGRARVQVVIDSVYRDRLSYAALCHEVTTQAHMVVDDSELTVPPFSALAGLRPGDTMTLEVSSSRISSDTRPTGPRVALEALHEGFIDGPVICRSRPIASDRRHAYLELLEPGACGRAVRVLRSKIGNQAKGPGGLFSVTVSRDESAAKAYTRVGAEAGLLESLGVKIEPESGCLMSTRPLGWEDHERLSELGDDSEWQAVVTALLRDSNRMVVDVGVTSSQLPEPGDLVSACVSGIQPYGVFLESHGGARGLVHKSAMPRAWRPEELQIGARIEVEVLSIDEERCRFNARVRGQQADRSVLPAAGDLLDAKVTRIEPYGAFVRLPGGQGALIHISQLSDKFVKDPADVVSVGETVRIRILSVEKEPRLRIAAALKGVDSAAER